MCWIERHLADCWWFGSRHAETRQESATEERRKASRIRASSAASSNESKNTNSSRRGRRRCHTCEWTITGNKDIAWFWRMNIWIATSRCLFESTKNANAMTSLLRIVLKILLELFAASLKAKERAPSPRRIWLRVVNREAIRPKATLSSCIVN